MQVDVKTHDEKELAGARVFSTLKTKLDEAQLGSGNHLAVSAVLNLAEQEQIPTSADATAMTNFLGQVHDIIHGILWTDLIDMKTAEYSTYNSYHTQMTACTAASTGSAAHSALATAITGTSSSRAQHNSCRATESTEQCEYAGTAGAQGCTSNGACTTAVNAAGTIASASTANAEQSGMHSQCTPPAVCDASSNNCEDVTSTTDLTAANAGTVIAAWESWFSTSISTFQNWDNNVLTEVMQQACIDERIEHRDQRNLCNEKQTTFEANWCSFYCAVDSMCTTRESCSNGILTNYDNNIQGLQDASDLRDKQSCILMHMLCLIQELIDGKTDMTACDSNGTNTATQCHPIWGNDFTRPTAAPTCDTSTGTDGAQGSVASFGVLAEPAPGDAGWATSTNSGYANLPANAGAGPITSCATCPTD